MQLVFYSVGFDVASSYISAMWSRRKAVAGEMAVRVGRWCGKVGKRIFVLQNVVAEWHEKIMHNKAHDGNKASSNTHIVTSIS